MSDTKKGSKRLITGLIIGSAVGAAVGVALAPQPGNVTREKLKAGVSKLGIRAKDAVDENVTQIQDGADKIAQGSKGFFSKLVSAVKESVKETADEIRPKTKTPRDEE